MTRGRVALALALTVGSAGAQQMPANLEGYLRDIVRLTPAEFAAARSGKTVSKLLPTENDRDITVFGIARLPTTASAYFALATDPRRTVAARARAFGLLSDPVIDGELQRISIDATEIDDLRKCKPNDCDFKLPGSTMQEFVTTVDWNSPRRHAQVDSIVRAQVRRFVANYRARGNAAMIHYDDRGGVMSSEVFRELVAQSPVLKDLAPALQSYLLSYPAGRPEHVSDMIFWSDDRMPRLRPTFSISHLMVYTPPAGIPLIARKQIYANHYFEGAFDLMSAMDALDGNGMFLIVVRRYRFDNLPGGVLNIRGRVRSALVDALRDDLERTRSSS